MEKSLDANEMFTITFPQRTYSETSTNAACYMNREHPLMYAKLFVTIVTSVRALRWSEDNFIE